MLEILRELYNLAYADFTWLICMLLSSFSRQIKPGLLPWCFLIVSIPQSASCQPSMASAGNCSADGILAGGVDEGMNRGELPAVPGEKLILSQSQFDSAMPADGRRFQARSSRLPEGTAGSGTGQARGLLEGSGMFLSKQFKVRNSPSAWLLAVSGPSNSGNSVLGSNLAVSGSISDSNVAVSDSPPGPGSAVNGLEQTPGLSSTEKVSASGRAALSARECVSCAGQSNDMLNHRMHSADKLMNDGEKLVAGKLRLCRHIETFLAQSRAKLTLEDYRTLMEEYQQSLGTYKLHRREFFEHCKAFHPASPTPGQTQTTVPVVPAQANVSTSSLKPLQLKAEQKCAQLVKMESGLLASEQQLDSLVKKLTSAWGKESPLVFGSMWADAQNLAIGNQATASEFNHMAIQKTSTASHQVAALIAEANRDGAYGAHMKAYKELSENNTLQQDLFERANQHGKFALMMLSKLQAMRPQGSPQFSSSTTSYSAADLHAESVALEKEYEELQSKFRELSEAKKFLPSTKSGL